ncbi:FecCD family ABC transporter permease [Methanocaldococcus sp.]
MYFEDKRKLSILFLSFIFMIFTMFLAICIGTYYVPIYKVLEILKAHILGLDVMGIYNTVVWDIRVPRVIVALLIGMALSTAGATYQGVFRNPLVSPYILGVSAGAAFGASLSIMFPQIPLSTQLSAFIFGIIAVFGAYSMAKVRGETPLVTLLLSGVIIGSFFSAIVAVFQYIANEAQLKAIVFWLMGGLYHIGWQDVFSISLFIPISLILLLINAWKLNIISMGDDEAKALGIDVEKLKLFLIFISTFMVSIAVSVAGIIGWVGLMIPHASRLIIGPDHRYLLPLSAIMGGIFLIICDTIARSLTTGEIPLGIVTALFGTPYLLYLIRSKKDKFFSG